MVDPRLLVGTAVVTRDDDDDDNAFRWLICREWIGVGDANPLVGEGTSVTTTAITAGNSRANFVLLANMIAFIVNLISLAQSSSLKSRNLCTNRKLDASRPGDS